MPQAAVVIVGAGASGLSAVACQLSTRKNRQQTSSHNLEQTDRHSHEVFSLTDAIRAEAYHVHAFRRRSRNRRSISLRAKARAARKCSRAASRRPRRNSSSPHAAK